MVGLGVLVYDTVHADPGVRHHRCRLTTYVAVSGVLWRQQHYYHQQYLSDAKKSNGYCGIGGTGVCMGDPSEGPAVTPHSGPHSSR